MTETPHTDNTEPERDNPGDENPQTPPAAEGDTAPTEKEPEHGSPATGTPTGPPAD